MALSALSSARSLARFLVKNGRYIHATAPAAGYKSSVSLEKIYPGSGLDMTKSTQPPKSEGINFSGYIPIEQLQVSYSRSSGPGGQNVNKVNTKVDLRFHVATAEWLTQELKEKIAEKYKSSITSDGCLLIRSDKTRSQQLNLADALDKLRHMIHTASYVPPPPSSEAVERQRRRHEAAVRERLRNKRDRSLVKQSRRGPESEF
ncbi:large ribosomal subunit protein mL62-like [Penaeus indicus]|uniref:large ribosomal subunit protein mL62-like n=1 Tax=Penaeus indicus TaxID=29960 RepID=UPI00300CED0B